MDLEMPVMDGYAAARRIRAALPECRVIALTIYGGESERQQAFEAWVSELIVKGAPLETLLRAIRAACADEGISEGISEGAEQ